MQFTPAEQLEIDRFLVEYGNDLRAVRSAGLTTNITMLHNAARYGTLAVVKYLVSQGLSIHARDSRRDAPFHYALLNDNNVASTEIVKFFVSQGVDVHAKDGSGWTPLHIAAFRENLETVKLLVSKGAEVNARDNGGDTPLHNAVSKQNIDIIKLLVSHGADIHAEGKADVSFVISSSGMYRTPFNLARHSVANAKIASDRAKAMAVVAALEGR